MKFLVCFSAFFLLSVTATAQDTTKHDPLIDPGGSYPVFANSAELVHITTRYGSPTILRHDLHDFTQAGQVAGPGLNGYSDHLELSPERRMDYVAADVNGDGKDKLFISRAGPSSILEVSVSSPRRQAGLLWTWDPTFVHEFPEDTVAGPIRLIAANLDTIPGEELVEFLYTTDPMKWIAGYCYNSFDEATQEPNSKILITGGYYDYVQEFDIAAGDFDADGLDEIMMVRRDLFNSEIQLVIAIFKYDPQQNDFFVWSYWPGNGTVINWNNMTRLKITAGDFFNKGFDEAVISATEKNGNDGRQVFSYISIVPESKTISLDYPILGNVPNGWTWGLGWNTNAVAKDLNPLKVDGDELVVGGAGELAILRFNELLKPYYLFNTPSRQWDFLPYERRKFLAVEDVNADTAEASWTQEVVLATQNWSSTDSTTIFQVFEVTTSESDSITGLVEKYAASGGSPSSAFSEFVMGDFDGDAIRLGTPKLITKEFVYQPIVQLNVPPTHFDYLNNQVYDVCKVYGSTPSEFKVTYSETQSSTSHFSSELSQSWGVSGELSGGLSLFGASVKAYVKGSYDNGYYGSQTLDTTVTTQQVIESTGDDWLLATVTDYDFWEYPIYAMGNQMGNVLMMIPHFRGTEWFPTRNVIARNWIADHEVGNLFSYPPKDDISNWLGSNRLLTTFTGKYVSQASSGSWTLDLSTQQIDDQMLTSAIGTEVGLSVKNWGIEAKVSGRYSREEITTHTSTATKNVEIEVIVSDTDPLFGDTDYLVTPYIYWGQNGSMVIDYAIDPSSSGDTLYGTFWDDNYLSHSDPGFILPWRLDSFKGIGNTGNLKLYSKSLHVSPFAPSAGDTAFITANIHNFSLKNTAGPVTVRFYLGNPTNGGTPIVGIDGLIDLTTDGPIMKQNRATVEMEWVVPSGLDNTARIYAVIDPDNTITEVHEDNNIGFVPLMVQGTTDIEDETKYQLPDRYTLEQNYPNPFNPSTKLRYSVPQSSNVAIKIFDVLGREVETLVNEEKSVGTYELIWNASNLPSGVYFYRLQAGSFVQTRKMILLK